MDPAILYSLGRRRDSRHGTALLPLTPWQGARALWRVGVLREGGTLDDMAGVDAVELRVTSYGGSRPGSLPWILREVAAADFDVPDSVAAVRAGIAWHAELDLTAEELLLPVEDGGSRTYWYEWRTRGSAGPTVLAAGEMVLRAAAGSGDAAYALTSDLPPALAAVLWVDWPLAGVADEDDPSDDPRGVAGSRTYDPDTDTSWERVKDGDGLLVWKVRSSAGGGGPLSGQVTEGGVAVTEGGVPVTEGQS